MKIAAFALSLLALSLSIPASPVSAHEAFENDFPTVTRADYVFGCMATNGQSREALERCSCSIDVIASILPHDRYVEAETVLSLRLVSGERMSVFKTSNDLNAVVVDLRRAQAEAEIRCF